MSEDGGIVIFWCEGCGNEILLPKDDNTPVLRHQYPHPRLLLPALYHLGWYSFFFMQISLAGVCVFSFPVAYFNGRLTMRRGLCPGI